MSPDFIQNSDQLLDKLQFKRSARSIALWYFILGSVWIVGSDLILFWIIPGASVHMASEISKGLLFVTVTTILVYVLSSRKIQNLHASILSDRLKDTQNLLKTLENNLGEAVFIVNPEDRTICSCNEAAEKIFGYECKELIGQNTRLLHVSNDSYKKFSIQSERALEKSGVFRGRFEMKRKNGSIFASENTVVALDGEKGWKDGVISMTRDITERNELEARIQQTQKMESIGTLASGVAHEINNPLQCIAGFAELIQNNSSSADSNVRKNAAEIKTAVKHAHEIIHNMLGFSRDNENEQFESISARDIIESSLLLIHAVIRQNKIKLDMDIGNELPPVKCRKHQIQQVLVNLLINSKDALIENEPKNSRKKQIHLTASVISKDNQNWIRFTVEDNGPGISEEARESIFEPFFTTKPEGKGTGLGLWITYEIVQKHGGEISVESKADEYTRFHVDLPVDDLNKKDDQAHRQSR